MLQWTLSNLACQNTDEVLKMGDANEPKTATYSQVKKKKGKFFYHLSNHKW